MVRRKRALAASITLLFVGAIVLAGAHQSFTTHCSRHEDGRVVDVIDHGHEALPLNSTSAIEHRSPQFEDVECAIAVFIESLHIALDAESPKASLGAWQISRYAPTLTATHPIPLLARAPKNSPPLVV